MDAVVRRGKRLLFDHLEDPQPKAGQVLVRTLCCGICGSDLHALDHADHLFALTARAGAGGATDPNKDIVFGHEFSAEILDHGPGAKGRLPAGTQVVSMPLAIGPDGVELIGLSNRFSGGFGQQMVLTEDLLLPVPNGLDPATAALTEPFAVGVHAVEASSVDADTVAMVIGCGPIGLAVIAALKLRGHGRIIASDYSAKRRQLAAHFGADEVVNPAEHSPHDRWEALDVPATLAELTRRRMLGQKTKRAVIFECVGVPGLLGSLIAAAPPEAQIVVAGVCMEADRIEPAMGIIKQLDVRFVYAYTPSEFELTLNALADGRIDGAAMITGTTALAGVEQAFSDMRQPEQHAKIMIDHRTPQEGSRP